MVAALHGDTIERKAFGCLSMYTVSFLRSSQEHGNITIMLHIRFVSNHCNTIIYVIRLELHTSAGSVSSFY